MKPLHIPVYAGKALAGILSLFIILLALPALAASNNIAQSYLVKTNQISQINVSVSSIPVCVRVAPQGADACFDLHGCSPKKVWLEAEQADGVLTVREGRERVIAFGQEVLTLEITLPVDYAGGLTLDTDSGAVTLAALTLRSLAVTTSSGKIDLAPITARQVALTSTSGGVICAGVTAAALSIDAVSGAVEVTGIHASETNARCDSADVHLGFAAFDAADVRVTSTSGKVTLALPETAGFRFDISRVSANVESDYAAIENLGQAPDVLSGQVGDARGNLSIVSISGDVAVNRQ